MKTSNLRAVVRFERETGDRDGRLYLQYTTAPLPISIPYKDAKLLAASDKATVQARLERALVEFER